METIDLVANMNNLFRTITNAREDVCPACRVDMEEIDNRGYTAKAPDRDSEPDYVITARIYRCPVCFEIKEVKE